MGEPGKGAQIAAQSLFTAASAANAIPVAGQFVSAGLAIAGMFTKLFGGKKAKKEAARKEAEQGRQAQATQAITAQSGAVGGGSAAQQGTVQNTTAPPTVSSAPGFTSWGGGSAPPVQQALNKYTGMPS